MRWWAFIAIWEQLIYIQKQNLHTFSFESASWEKILKVFFFTCLPMKPTRANERKENDEQNQVLKNRTHGKLIGIQNSLVD